MMNLFVGGAQACLARYICIDSADTRVFRLQLGEIDELDAPPATVLVTKPYIPQTLGESLQECYRAWGTAQHAW